MNETHKPHPLLEDVLAEAAPADFEQDLLSRTLQEVRHRKHVRARTRRLVLMAVAVGLPMAAWRLALPPSEVREARTWPVTVVTSHSLSPGVIVESKPGTVTLVGSSLGAVALVETKPQDDWVHEITDAELLRMAAGRPAALVRRSPTDAELVFVNAADRDGFPVQ